MNETSSQPALALPASHDARRHELADFLRQRREEVAPTQVGLAPGGRRRTPGLRREEVASLAGISTTYYTWMEQGRELHPSAQVLASLARALLLSGEETAYLFDLAGQAQPANAPAHTEPAVSPMLQRILDNQGCACSLVQDERWNVLAWNEATRLVTFDFPNIPPDGRNYVWLTFTDEAYRARLRNWESQARELVARFRSGTEAYAGSAWLTDLVARLSAASPEFARWWPLHEVAGERNRVKVFDHPTAGTLSFEHMAFDVADASASGPRLRLFINNPAPNTDTRERMKRLLRG